MHGKDISKGEVGRHHRTHSTVKVDSGSDPKVIHETQNSNGEKGHTTSRPDGGIHNHGTHAEKGHGSSWGSKSDSKGESKSDGGFFSGLFD